MKTIFTLLASLLITGSTFAADTRSTATLTIRSATESGIVVVVDDNRYDFGTNSIMISDLDPGEHQVIVYQEKANSPVTCFQKTYDEVFNSAVMLKPRTNLQIAIDDCGSVTFNETKAKRPLLGDTWNGENYFDNNPAANNDYSKAISNYDFSRVLWAISKESSDMNRMRSAEQIIHTNYLTVDEVEKLMQLFCSEENKLEVAKLAYNKTVDQDNYYAVNDIFKSDNSRDELARCIRH